MRFDAVEQDVDVTAEDLALAPDNVPLPSYFAGLVDSAAPLSDPIEPSASYDAEATVDDDDGDDLEMREYAPPGGRQPLFVSRATASATTSEADGDELFHVEAVERAYSVGSEDAPFEEEVEYETAGQDGVRAEDFAGRRDAWPSTLEDRDRLFDDAEAVEDDYINVEGDDDLVSAPEEDDDDADEDPTLRKDPFGRPVRYEDYGSEIEYDENDIREDPLMRSYDDRYDESSRFDKADDASVRDTSVEDGGSAMDSAEGEWAGRRKVDGDDMRGAGDEAAEENGSRVETLELDSDSGSEVQAEAEGGVDELEEDADQLQAASPVFADTALGTAEESTAEPSFPASTATTPGLATPMLLTPALSDYAADPGLASGALADVDEAEAEAVMSIASTTGEADASIGFARDDDDDDDDERERVDEGVLADSSVAMEQETPSVPVEQAPPSLGDPVQLVADESEAVLDSAPIEADVSDAELADVEAEDAEPDRIALGLIEAAAAASVAVGGAQDFPDSSISAFTEMYDPTPMPAMQANSATAETEQVPVSDEQSSPGSPAAMTINPLEVLYANEDSEVCSLIRAFETED